MTSLAEAPLLVRIFEGPLAAKRIESMGLRPDYFQRASEAGHRRKLTCDPLHPKTFPGQVTWAETTRAIRLELGGLNRGWTARSTRNYETAFNARARMAIAVVGGDSFTGVRGFRDPKLVRARGPVTKQRVDHNRSVQLSIPLAGIVEPAENDEEAETWLLVMNARQDQLFLELSLPVAINGCGRVDGWAERILIPPLELPDAVTPTVSAEDADDTHDVHVERKV